MDAESLYENMCVVQCLLLEGPVTFCGHSSHSNSLHPNTITNNVGAILLIQNVHLHALQVEPGIGGKSPTVTEPQFNTVDRLRPWLLIAIRNSPDTQNNRH